MNKKPLIKVVFYFFIMSSLGDIGYLYGNPFFNNQL